MNIDEVKEYARSSLRQLKAETVEGSYTATVDGSSYGTKYVEYAIGFDPGDWKEAVDSLIESLEHAAAATENQKAEGECSRLLNGPTKVVVAWRYGKDNPIAVDEDFDSKGRYYIHTRVAFWRSNGTYN